MPTIEDLLDKPKFPDKKTIITDFNSTKVVCQKLTESNLNEEFDNRIYNLVEKVYKSAYDDIKGEYLRALKGKEAIFDNGNFNQSVSKLQYYSREKEINKEIKKYNFTFKNDVVETIDEFLSLQYTKAKLDAKNLVLDTYYLILKQKLLSQNSDYGHLN